MTEAPHFREGRVHDKTLDIKKKSSIFAVIKKINTHLKFKIYV